MNEFEEQQTIAQTLTETLQDIDTSVPKKNITLFNFAIIILIVVSIALILPLVSGVGNFSVNKNDTLKFKLNEKEKARKGKNGNSNGVTTSRSQKYDIDSKHGLKKRVVGDIRKMNDPNAYDFDIDELINEDEVEKNNELSQRLSKFNGDKNAANNQFV